MRLEALINKNYDLLTANDREIANTIFREKKAVREMNSTQLSSFLNISRTTLVRFMKKLGIATFAEFRLLLEEEQGSRNVMSFGMRDILNHYHTVIDELKKHDYSQVCRMIAGADTIYLYGSGNEQKAVAEEFKRIFLIFGKYCVDLFDFGEVEFARERFRENDLFVAISLSGESSEAIRVMRCVQGSEIRTLSLTRGANNSLARMCQENLYVGTRTVYQTERESYEMVAAFYILLDILTVRYLEYTEPAEADTGATGKGAVRSGGRIEELLNSRYDSFSENEKYICHYLTGHYRECAFHTIAEFAEECSVSQTMLVRFAKKLGMSGYGELKARLKIDLEENPVSSEGLMEKVTQSYYKMMDDLVKRDMTGIFENLEQAERVFIYGSGSSQTRAASEMKRIFLPVKEMVHIHGHDMCRALQKTAGDKDLVILISLSGESQAVVKLGRALRTNHVPAVSITRLKNNTLASLCSENLYINSIQMPVEYDVEYEIATPYFILIEFLYLSYRNFLSRK